MGILDNLSIAVIIIVAVALLTVLSMNLAKKGDSNNNSNSTTTAVLSPSFHENLTAENQRILLGETETQIAHNAMSAMPWNNCLDANKVYCSGALTRQPGGCMKMRYYPKCGSSCNGGCPSACNTCVAGSCQ